MRTRFMTKGTNMLAAVATLLDFRLFVGRTPQKYTSDKAREDVIGHDDRNDRDYLFTNILAASAYLDFGDVPIDFLPMRNRTPKTLDNA